MLGEDKSKMSPTNIHSLKRERDQAEIQLYALIVMLNGLEKSQPEISIRKINKMVPLCLKVARGEYKVK